MITAEGARALECAIIEQAVRDYRSAKGDNWKANAVRAEVEDFFRSDWFRLINTTRMNGQEYISLLRKEREENIRECRKH